MQKTSLICHINLAKGYRGGERQTELLIRSLALQGCQQRLIARADDALFHALADVRGLERVGVTQPYLLQVRHCHGASVLQVHEAKAGHMACVANALYGVPYVLTRRVDKPPRASWLNRRLYRNASEVVAVSQAITNIVKKQFPLVNANVIADAHSDLPVDPAQVERIKKRFEGKFLVGHAGALVNRHKGQLFLIQAMQELADKYPELHLILLGAGEDEDMLKAAAEGMSNVSFEGFSEHLGDYLAALDLFAFPSLFEGLGSVLLDAMQAGLPIVASRVGGIPEIVQHEHNGLLVEPGNAQALAQAIERVFNEKSLRQRLSDEARTVADAYAPHEMAVRYQHIYRSLENTPG